MSMPEGVQACAWLYMQGVRGDDEIQAVPCRGKTKKMWSGTEVRMSRLHLILLSLAAGSHGWFLSRSQMHSKELAHVIIGTNKFA